MSPTVFAIRHPESVRQRLVRELAASENILPGTRVHKSAAPEDAVVRTANAHKLGVPLATCATASFTLIISSCVDARAVIQFYAFGVHGHVFGKSAIPYCGATSRSYLTSRAAAPCVTGHNCGDIAGSALHFIRP